MRLTFVTDVGESYSVEIDPQMELENIMALLEAESGIPVQEQSLSFEGRDLDDPKATISDYNVREDSMLLLRRKIMVAGRQAEQDAEMMRLQILGDSNLMRELRTMQPELAEAAQHNPTRFAELLRQTRARHQQAEQQRLQEMATLDADPYNVDAQRRIEEAIRQQAVLENMETALEFSPEAFGRVIMLYIPVEVNGVPLVAFVDSGAQQTIMSPEYAEKCGIMRLLDSRFSGMARGVGTAKILGRIHTAQMKIGNSHLPCSFTIMEGREVDMLLGLDMLKAHQACIDLQRNCLRIQGEEIRFLSDHELPAKARQDLSGLGASTDEGSSTAASTSNSSFPGSGNRLAHSTPQPVIGTGHPPSASQAAKYPEHAIARLTDLGATRAQAIEALTSANGNIDLAASLLFSF